MLTLVMEGRARSKRVDPFVERKVVRVGSELVRHIQWLGEVGTGHHQTAARICSDINLLLPLPVRRLCVFAFTPHMLMVV